MVAEMVGQELAGSVMRSLYVGDYHSETDHRVMRLSCCGLEIAVQAAADENYARGSIGRHRLVMLEAMVDDIRVMVLKDYKCRFVGEQSFCLLFYDLQTRANCVVYGRREQRGYMFSVQSGQLLTV